MATYELSDHDNNNRELGFRQGYRAGLLKAAEIAHDMSDDDDNSIEVAIRAAAEKEK